MGCATSKDAAPSPGSRFADRGRRKIYATRFDPSAPEGQAVTGNGFLLSGADATKRDKTDEIERERVMRSAAVARRIHQVTTLACLCPAFDATDFPDLPQSSSRRQTSRRRSTVFASNSTSRTTSPRPLFATVRSPSASVTSSGTINVLTPTSAPSPLVSQTGSSFHRFLDADDGSGSASVSLGQALSDGGLVVSEEDDEDAAEARRMHIQLDNDWAPPRAGYDAPEPTNEQRDQRIAAIVGPAIRAGRVNRDPSEFPVVHEHPQYIVHSERIVRPWLDELLAMAAEASAHSPRGRGSVTSHNMFASPADTELASETSSGGPPHHQPVALLQPVSVVTDRPPWLPPLPAVTAVPSSL